MLEEDTRAAISAGYAALRKGGLRNRPAQRQMIAAVARACAADSPGGVTLIEAPTGTGKTLAYLLAAALVARATDRRLLVSTATIALQQQILKHDLPQLAAVLGDPEPRLAKGRRRHVCDRNLTHAAAGAPGQDALWDDPLGAPPLSPADAASAQAMIEARAAGTWGGDLDEWPERPSPALLQAVTTGSGGCPGHRCPYAANCPSLRARAGIATARLVVTNHALLLADLLNPAGSTLAANPAGTLLVCDEGHQLPRVARQTLASRLVPAHLGGHLDGLAATLRAAASATEVDLVAALTDVTTLRDIAGDLQHAFASCSADLPGHGRSLTPAQRDSLAPVLGRAAEPADRLVAVVEKAAAALRLTVEGPVARQAVAGQILDRLARLRDTLANLHALSVALVSPSPDIARWIEPGVNGGHAALAATHLDTGRILGPLLGTLGASILVSATLRRLGSFAPLERELGRATDTLALPSPFDLAEQGELRLVEDAPAPREEDAHTAAVLAAIERHHAPGEGTLVLFTSHRQMQAVAEQLPAPLHASARLQTDGAIPDLLGAHAADVAAGKTAILMGVATFAEGLDLPGAQCRALILAKLPFAVPDDPIERARAAACETRGGNAFAEIALPDTHLRLTQALGRLIRTETDHGWAVIVDARLSATRYGKSLLRHLPPFRVSRVLVGVKPGARGAVSRKPRHKRPLCSTKAPLRAGDTAPHGQSRTFPIRSRARPTAPQPSAGEPPANRDLFPGHPAPGGAGLAGGRALGRSPA